MRYGHTLLFAIYYDVSFCKGYEYGVFKSLGKRNAERKGVAARARDAANAKATEKIAAFRVGAPKHLPCSIC